VTKDTGILVTGATGFIGGRVCERLVQAGFKNVRGLVHDFSHAPRVARLPIELCQGDLMNPKSVKDALADCKIVFHLGLGPGPGIASGTRNLLKTAGDAHVERFVHISTTSVYGLKPAANAATEEARPRPTGNEYSDYKLAAERTVQYFITRGLPAAILRPSIVIGPYSHWSIGVINQLRQGNYQLIDEGNGLCNTTYVDNLVDAMLLAAQKPEAVGQIFTITDGERITWGDFVRAHARMLEAELSFDTISSIEVENHYKKQPGLMKASMKASRKVLTGPQLRILLKEIPVADRIITWAWYRTQTMSEVEKDKLRTRLSGGGPALNSAGSNAMPDAAKVAIQSSDVLFSIEKARRLLGYSPRIQFAEAMQRTEQWLRFANFLGAA
jgi:nucleoside-diphosphate-sugar epimerase